MEQKQSVIRHLDNKGNSGALPHLVPSTHSLSLSTSLTANRTGDQGSNSTTPGQGGGLSQVEGGHVAWSKEEWGVRWAPGGALPPRTPHASHASGSQLGKQRHSRDRYNMRCLCKAAAVGGREGEGTWPGVGGHGMVAVCACLEGSHRLLIADKGSYSSSTSHTSRHTCKASTQQISGRG